MKKLAYVMLGILLMASCGKQSIPTEYSEENRTARIFPDYKGVVVPPNISPLNFMVQENADNYAAVSYTHLTLPTKYSWCRSRWSPYH